MHRQHVEAHDTHHKLYPPEAYLDVLYREPPNSHSRLQQALYFGPGLLLVVLVYFTGGFVPFIFSLGAVLLYGYLNQTIHSAIHVKGHWLERFDWFWHLRVVHWLHHTRDVNFGIITFWCDRLAGTAESVTSSDLENSKEAWK
jgi:hypothetical protein